MAKHKTKETKVKAAPAKKSKRAKVEARVFADADNNGAGAKVLKTPVVTTPAPAPVVLSGKTTPERETRNGVKRPAPGGLCAAVWEALDAMHAAGIVPATKDVRDLATAKSWNENNATAELSAWRRFMGLSKPQTGKRGPRRKTAPKAAPPATRVDGTPDTYLA